MELPRSLSYETLVSSLPISSSYTSPNHNENIMSNMYQYYLSGQLTDVTLVAGDLKIKAHRIVLSSASQYFSIMFNSDLLESHSEVVTFKDIDGNALKDLVKFSYTGQIDLNEDSVESLLSTSSFLGFLEVVEATSNFLLRQLHPTNCIGIAMFADSRCCFQLRDAAMNFISENFVAVVLHEEFLMLSYTQLSNLLLSEDLNVPSETSIFDAVMHWIKHDKENRMTFLSTLLQYVKLPLLSPEYLADVVIPEVGSEGAKLVIEAFQYHLLPERRSRLSSFRTNPRKSTLASVIAIGGSNIPGSEHMEVYNPRLNIWQFHGPLPKDWKCGRLQMAVVSNAGEIYVAGGREDLRTLNSFEIYDVILMKSRRLPDMLTPRHGLGLAVIQPSGLVYAVGGHDGWSFLSSVERYDPYSCKWSYVEPLTSARSTAGVAVLNNQIYAIGGRDGMCCLSSVEVYNPHRNKWKCCASMNKCRGGVGVAVLNDYIFALGGHDLSSNTPSIRFSCVERYDRKKNKWTYVAQLDIARDSIGAAIVGNKILAAGGFDGTSYLRRVELYDPLKDEWSQLSDMKAGRAGPCLTTARFMLSVYRRKYN